MFADRVTEMHLDAPDGPVIGRLHPGALVRVDAVAARFVRFTVPRYTSDRPLVAFVERSALVSHQVPEVPPEQSGKALRDFPVQLWVGERYLTSMLCGEFRLSDGGRRASQYFAGIEIEARTEAVEWLLGEKRRRGPLTCPHRLVYRAPHGLLLQGGRLGSDSTPIASVPNSFRVPNLSDDDPVVDGLERHASVYWLVETLRGLTCHEWQFTDVRRKAGHAFYDFEGVLRRQKDPRLRAEFPLEYRASGPDRNTGSLSVIGPHFRNGGYRCGQSLAVLGADADIIYVLNPGLIPSEPLPTGRELVAFDPGDVEHWFRHGAACENARRDAAVRIAQDPSAADHLGIHRDCYDELAE